MAQISKAGLVGLLLLAGSAWAASVGDIKGRPVSGRPLEVNVPFAVDEPRDRACASANVRYGSTLPRSTLHVQGHGLNRNLLVTSRANVTEQPVTVAVRVGCGAKAVSRKFVLMTNMAAAKNPTIIKTAAKQPAPESTLKAPAPESTVKPPTPKPALATPGEPLFPPPVAEAAPPASPALAADGSLMEDLRKARTEAATAIAQLAATRKELAAVLDVERRTSQTLINADHQIRAAKSEAAHMRSVLQWVGGLLALGAAGLVWWEFQRVGFRLRKGTREQPAQEPTIYPSNEVPA